MASSTRTRYLVQGLCGLGLMIGPILELFSSSRPSMVHLFILLSGLWMTVGGGYSYLHPEKANSFSASLLARVAAYSFLTFLILFFFLLHLYGIADLFSTEDSTWGFVFAAFVLFMSLWLLFRSVSLRRKERQ